MLAKWLTIYFAEHEGGAERWLSYAAQHCDRSVPEGELTRLLVWAEAIVAGSGQAHPSSKRNAPQAKPTADLDEMYEIIRRGPGLAEYQESSPERLYDCPERQTDRVIEQWTSYTGQGDPFICFGADDRFWTRRRSEVGTGILQCHAQIVPSPMRDRYGKTADGHLSQHSKEGVGDRCFLVCEFDFSKLTPKGKPTIWGPLIERCEASGRSILDMNAAIAAHLARTRSAWMTVHSGGKSLQLWTPCRGEDETALHHWFGAEARRLGACPSTWCVSQFTRMPDGSRAPNREGKSVRQAIVYYDPKIL
jgi:hypothetical protein